MVNHENGPDEAFIVAMNAGYSHVFTFGPWMLLGGTILAIAGYYIRLGSSLGRRVAQIVCVLAFVWIFAGLSDGYRIFPLFSPSSLRDQPSLATVVKWVCLVGNGLIYSLFPLFLLVVLHRPRSQQKLTRPMGDGETP